MEKGSHFEVSIGAGDIVHLTIAGHLNTDALPDLLEWIQKVKETIKNLHAKKGPVLCLVDITGMKTYHADILTNFATLMKDNEPYILRTATFGGNVAITMAEDVIIALSGRNNLKAFHTKEEALAWLHPGIEAKKA